MTATAQERLSVELNGRADGNCADWEAYVRTHPRGTVFHLPQWSRAVARAYGHRPCHLIARRGSRVVGVLPLFLVRSVLAGRGLISVPYGTYGGILSGRGDVVAALADRARGLCHEYRAAYLELRHRDPVGLDLPVVDRYDTFRKALPGRPQDVLPGLPNKARAAIRGALRALGDDCVAIGPEHLDAIYDLYAITMRRLGSPNYSRALFRALLDEYGSDCVCMLVHDHGTPVAGVIGFVFRNELVGYFSGRIQNGPSRNAPSLLYVRLMEHAVRRGIGIFDFNRTRRDNPGPYDFKRHFGFDPSPLHYQVFVADGGPPPALTPANPKYALAIKVWRRMPLWLTRPVGGHITRWIP